MKTKIFLTALVIGLFSISNIQAQDKKSLSKEDVEVQEAVYSCPMHPEVKSKEEGKCSKCGMELKKMEMAKAYMCPMKCEGDKTYDKEGKCPKCGMELKEMKMEMKMKKDGDHSGHKH